MKTRNIIIKSLLTLGLVLGFSSCDKYEYEEEVSTFKVVETNYSDSREASEGFIRVNEEGFSVKTDAVGGWLKAELKEPMLVKVIIAQNTSPEARTANVILTKGDEVQRIPIMQLGVRDFIKDFKDVTLDRDGRKFTFITHTDNPAKVTIKALEGSTAPTDWLKTEAKDGKLILMADKLPEGTTERELALTVEAGLYKKSIKVKQIWGKPKYADVIGKYLLDYKPKAGEAQVQAEVEIKQSKEGETFKLHGLVAPITLKWDQENHSLIIPLGAQENPASFQPNELLVLSAAGLGYKNADGKKNLELKWDKEYYFKGQWVNTTTDVNLMFTFPPAGAEGKDKLHGLLFWKYDLNTESYIEDYKGEDGNGIYSISDFTLTKKL